MNQKYLYAWLFWACALCPPLLGQAAAFTPTQLHDELVNNPTSMACYAANITAGKDAEVADCINAVGVGSPYLVSRGLVSRNNFLGTWADVIDGIRSLAAGATKDKWVWRVEKLLIPKETIDYTDPITAAFFQEMITDGLSGATGPIDSTSVTARTTRQGSRAEVIWGPGTVISSKDVSCALRGACL